MAASDTSSGSTDDAARSARAAVLLHRYSLDISALVDQVVGRGSSGNQEVQVLTHLFAAGPSRPAALMSVTGAGRTGAARLVRRLEQVGLIERTHGQHDRRTVLTSLTAAGHERLALLDTALEAFFRSGANVVTELIELLSPLCAQRASDRRAESALAVAGRMGAAGAAYVAALGPSLDAAGGRSRLALSVLAAGDGVRPSHLAERLSLSSGGMTYVLDELEAGGLIERRHGQVADDRRAVVVRLTKTGRRSVDTMHRALIDHADELVEALSMTLVPSDGSASVPAADREHTDQGDIEWPSTE